MKRITALAVVTVLAFSCGKKKEMCTLACEDMEVGIQATGFNDSDIDTIILKQYAKGSNFSNAERVTFIYDRVLGMPSNTIGLVRLSRLYDWQILIPATNGIYPVSEISDENAATKNVDCKTNSGCYNEVLSFKLNSTVIQSNFITLSK